MNPNKLVVAFGVAKKMAKLGFPQETYFVWMTKRNEKEVWDRTMRSDYETGGETFLAAYTATELGPLMRKAEIQMRGKVMKDKMVEHLVKIAGFEDEANNRAKLLIYLVENKYICL